MKEFDKWKSYTRSRHLKIATRNLSSTAQFQQTNSSGGNAEFLTLSADSL
jgi:hypothetical protein